LLLLPDLDAFVPETVLKAGRLVADFPRSEVPDWVKHTVRVGALGPEVFRVPWNGGQARVIGLIPGQIVTGSLVDELTHRAGEAIADPERGLAKIAVIERHLGTGRIGLGFVRGFGLQRGALASTVAHDAHNVVVVGMSDAAMAAAVRRLANIGGGIVVVDGAEVIAELPLPVAGIVSDAPLDEVIARSRAVVVAAAQLGCTVEAPFQLLSFLALSVIPSLKITDRGLVDVDRFELVPLAVA
jgi:adenine deaminase